MIERVRLIQKEYEKASRENAYDFNVFEITRIHNLEDPMSLLLYELLNSNSRHGMKTEYLECFF